MKPLKWIIAVVGLAIGGGLAASAQADSQANAVSDRYLTSVETELTGKLDARDAVAGQQVVVKTRQAAKLADGTALPKGTKLVGRVLQVQAQDRSTGHNGSLVAIIFDHAELKAGQTLRLRSVIQAVAPAAAVVSPGDDLMAASASAAAGGGASIPSPARGGMGAGSSGGGLAPVRSSSQTAGSAGRTAGPISSTDAGAALGSATQTEGGVVRAAGDTVSTAPRATALPGVLLSTAVNAEASGTLIAPGENISLASGTRITLGVIAR